MSKNILTALLIVFTLFTPLVGCSVEPVRVNVVDNYEMPDKLYIRIKAITEGDLHFNSSTCYHMDKRALATAHMTLREKLVISRHSNNIWEALGWVYDTQVNYDKASDEHYIEALACITNKAGIKAFMEGRFRFFSIGFRHPKFGYVLKKGGGAQKAIFGMIIHEISVVNVPADMEARLLEKSLEKLALWERQTKPKPKKKKEK